eukprot:5718281-Prymnesium_polylepis.2
MARMGREHGCQELRLSWCARLAQHAAAVRALGVGEDRRQCQFRVGREAAKDAHGRLVVEGASPHGAQPHQIAVHEQPPEAEEDLHLEHQWALPGAP